MAEDQSPLLYQEAGELPAMEEALILEPMSEPPALLQLQTSQAVDMLPREDVLLCLPPTCLAAQSVEEMLTQVATIQESSRLLTEPLEALPAGPQGVVTAAAMETQLPGCLGTVAAQILMPKEKISPKAAEQLAALKTEASQTLLQVSSTTESHSMDGDQIQILEGFQVAEGELKAEPRFLSELAFTEGQPVPLENNSFLETAKEDFAARIHEGWTGCEIPLAAGRKPVHGESMLISGKGQRDIPMKPCTLRSSIQAKSSTKTVSSLLWFPRPAA